MPRRHTKGGFVAFGESEGKGHAADELDLEGRLLSAGDREALFVESQMIHDADDPQSRRQ